jgi:hypothetical protein
MTNFRSVLMLLAAGLVFLAGCSSGPPKELPPSLTLMQEVDSLLRAAAGGTRTPTKVADLNHHQSLFPRGYEAVKSGAVVVLWGAPLKGEGEAGSNEAVVAYEKAVPTDGGFVLLSAGTVKKMSADEFKAAPKAGK